MAESVFRYLAGIVRVTSILLLPILVIATGLSPSSCLYSEISRCIITTAPLFFSFAVRTIRILSVSETPEETSLISRKTVSVFPDRTLCFSSALRSVFESISSKPDTEIRGNISSFARISVKTVPVRVLIFIGSEASEAAFVSVSAFRVISS